VREREEGVGFEAEEGEGGNEGGGGVDVAGGDLGKEREGGRVRESSYVTGVCTYSFYPALPPSLPPSLPRLTSTYPFLSFLFSGSFKNTHACLAGAGASSPPSFPSFFFLPPPPPPPTLSLLSPRGVHREWMARRSSHVREGGKRRAGERERREEKELNE